MFCFKIPVDILRVASYYNFGQLAIIFIPMGTNGRWVLALINMVSGNGLHF